ncbi:hypothetical protein E2C01_088576 [Portunus trituberculatus]|uniref:Uncharacterized protein n=1 Tax=Portunus trituberculatus TaxID=210409 RepID=A0A5B7JF15_PORTR|nr:hypothetical protein [Portunus trituberculatus]
MRCRRQKGRQAGSQGRCFARLSGSLADASADVLQWVGEAPYWTRGSSPRREA